MSKKKYIAFVGDSFCASYSDVAKNDINQRFQKQTPYSYTTTVANHYGYEVLPYGFSGKSWWYSWYKFEQDCLGELNQIEAIVFCHTNCERINSTTHDYLPQMCGNNFPNYSKELNQASESYFKYIEDPAFNNWAQQQYFKMLAEKYSNIKTIHLHCFDGTDKWSNLLPGVVFTTTLSQVSIGEITGSEQEIIQSFTDNRANHLNKHNNKSLAKVIINALDNYTPGQYKLPLEIFEQPNHNAKNWPDGIFWTK